MEKSADKSTLLVTPSPRIFDLIIQIDIKGRNFFIPIFIHDKFYFFLNGDKNVYRFLHLMLVFHFV